MKKLVLLPAVLLALLGMGSTAMATGVNEPIQEGNASCGGNETGLPVIGLTTFTRKNDTVTFVYKLKGAIPNSSYAVELWGNSGGCHEIAFVGNVITSRGGNASKKGVVHVATSENLFFASSFGPNGYNDTPTVELEVPA